METLQFNKRKGVTKLIITEPFVTNIILFLTRLSVTWIVTMASADRMPVDNSWDRMRMDTVETYRTALTQPLPVGTHEDHENPHSLIIFKPGIIRTKVRAKTVGAITSTCSDRSFWRGGGK